MIYSLLILTFGIFLGQEYDLPLVKNSALYIYNLINFLLVTRISTVRNSLLD